MVQIGVISDIHANIDALTATLEDIYSKGIEMVLCTGDIVGYHTFPDETVQLLRKEKVICIRGNHDNDVVNKRFNITKKPDIFQFTYDNLSDDSLKWLNELPFSLEIIVEGVSIELSHGSPKDIEEYLFEESDEAVKYAKVCESDILLSGHTHLPWVKELEGTLFINSGSVGKPKIGRPVATWAHITVEGSLATSEIHEVKYDVENVATAATNAGFGKYADALRRGKV